MASVFDETNYPHQEITERIIHAAIEVHRELGPGLLESIYEEAMTMELASEGLAFVRQVELPLVYKEQRLSGVYRVDMVVENKVVVELKAVTAWHPIYEAQVMTYLRLGGWDIGLLLNFDCRLMREGVRRIVLSNRSPQRLCVSAVQESSEEPI